MNLRINKQIMVFSIKSQFFIDCPICSPHGLYLYQDTIYIYMSNKKHNCNNCCNNKNDNNDSERDPEPPRLPPNFSWSGEYIVSDLFDPKTGKKGIKVPFTWNGNNGNVQMIAGGEEYPIYFTNIIYNNKLYTYTYKWPHLQAEFLPPNESTCPINDDFSLGDLNAFLSTARYVGKVKLDGYWANHFRVSLVLPQNPSGFYLRFPIVLGDFFVDCSDSTKFLQILHFGYQNIYDPQLDEWIKIFEFSNCPGEIIPLPPCMPK
ncbi:MAG: hypothetical protein Terrestrivirus1_193 [Terrestrivirus sp.]|uniref:Uncharacterized protein n=1 Tax=Terrestrivirus sp. TaxID=2487775 RepID=A0A3G4ZPF1_9VIRU|nr:MAG: hypothetical protein Terrestrivirus1_193 [Terrestrivirus sp.]